MKLDTNTMIIMKSSLSKHFAVSKKMSSFGTEQVSSFGFLLSRINFALYQTDAQAITNSLLFSNDKLFKS